MSYLIVSQQYIQLCFFKSGGGGVTPSLTTTFTIHLNVRLFETP